MNRNEAYPMADVRTLQVRMGWASLELISDNVPELQLIVAGSDADVDDLKVTAAEGRISIEQPTYGLNPRLNTARWMQVVVRVPAFWKGEIMAGTTTGQLNVRGLSGSDLRLETVSGPIRAENLESITLLLQTVSGDVQGELLYSEQASVHTVSGTTELNDCAFRKAAVNTVSGDVLMALNAPLESLSGNSVAGTIRLYAPMNAADAVLKSATGRLRTSGISLTAGAPSIRVTSVSGALELNNNQTA